jgi:ribosomal-protein-alanine N-acetyltransferase
VRFHIRPMTAPDAAAVAFWHYDGEYTFYDFDQDAGDLAELLDLASWGDAYYAVDDDDGALVGFVQFVTRGELVDVGLGLRPELVGRGLGAAFLDSALRFATDHFGIDRFTLDVAAFNRRAITVYERAGFRETERFEHHTNGGLHPFVRMVR